MEDQTEEMVNYAGRKFKIYRNRLENGLAYILAIPEGMKDNAEIIMESYNSGGKRRRNYQENIEDSKKHSPLNLLIELGDLPIICPIIPDFIGDDDIPDYQQLAKECFTRPVQGFERIDLKVVECIDDAKRIIKEKTGKSILDKIFINGYSASGVFAQRFALIHPELVKKCCIGGAAGDIPIPSDELGYPIGIADYEELFGKKFDRDSHKSIKFAYYVAEKEAMEDGSCDVAGHKVQIDKFGNRINKTQIPAPMHDMSYRLNSVPLEVGRKQRELFGEDLNDRWKNSLRYLREYGYDISGIICKKVGHRGIFNIEFNPYMPELAQRLLDFYKAGKAFEFDEETCAREIDMAFQRKREGQARIEAKLDKKENLVASERQEENRYLNIGEK